MDLSESARKVLVVDDDAAVRLLLKAILTTDGFDVDLAPHAEAALEMIDPHRQVLVITDLNMPVRSGIDLIRRVRALSPNFPILVVSSDETSIAQVAGISKLECLPKPFALDALRAAIQRLLSRND